MLVKDRLAEAIDGRWKDHRDVACSYLHGVIESHKMERAPVRTYLCLSHFPLFGPYYFFIHGYAQMIFKQYD